MTPFLAPPQPLPDEVLREIASLGRSARMESKLKVRQPLSKVELVGKLTEMSAMTDDVIRHVRRISTELRPAVLDDLEVRTWAGGLGAEEHGALVVESP